MAGPRFFVFDKINEAFYEFGRDFVNIDCIAAEKSNQRVECCFIHVGIACSPFVL